jgi:hypothetical protein
MLSGRIRQLEQELGVPNVERGHRFHGFTADAERVLKWAHAIPVASAPVEDRPEGGARTRDYDPRSDTWTAVAPMAFPRQYHSIAVVLPDGRVLTADGVDLRPGVVSATIVRWRCSALGISRWVHDPWSRRRRQRSPQCDVQHRHADPNGVDSVVLIRPGAVTHHTDARAPLREAVNHRAHRYAGNRRRAGERQPGAARVLHGCSS